MDKNYFLNISYFKGSECFFFNRVPFDSVQVAFDYLSSTALNLGLTVRLDSNEGFRLYYRLTDADSNTIIELTRYGK